MAQGVTSSFTEDVSFTSKFQMTKNDDVLNIIGATVTMKSPAGDLFTNEGNDTVLIEDSMLVLEGVNLAFYLGSGDDTLTVNNSTISAPISTGSGNDIVIVRGTTGSKVYQTSELTFGNGDDMLELVAIMENNGTIDFGTNGSGKLRFNGGSLLGDGNVYGITDLEVTTSGGILGSILTLSEQETSITLNGDFHGTTDENIISITGSTTNLFVESVINTNICLSLSNTSLAQTGEGILRFQKKDNPSSYSDRRAIYIDKSEVNIHNVEITGNHSFVGGHNISASGGAIVLDDGILNLTNASFVNNYVKTGDSLRIAFGGAIVQNYGTMNLTNVSFVNNHVIVTTSKYNLKACGSGGAIVQNGGSMTILNALFEENHASASAYGASTSVTGGAIHINGGTATIVSATFSNNSAKDLSGVGCGGAVYLSSAVANIEDTAFVGNDAASGGAVYIKDSVLNYKITAGKELSNIKNSSWDYSNGQFMFLDNHSIVNFIVDEDAKLKIGDDSYEIPPLNYKAPLPFFDSIASLERETYDYNIIINKQGAGHLLVNSFVDQYNGLWIVSEGMLELAYTRSLEWAVSESKYLYSAPIGRTICLDDWTIEEKGTLILSSENDTINMGETKAIGGILDVGGGADTINTNGFEISEGTILFHNVSINDGQIGVTLHNRSTTEGCSFTLTGSVLNSDYTGTDLEDEIIINGESTINGLIDMGGGINSIHVNGTLAMANAFKIQKDGETSVYAYYGSTITDNTLTVYADAEAARDVITLDWSDQTDLDKVRILVSTDSTFETFEFNLELYNQTKSFTLDLQQGYFIQFQAQDEDGWKQRLLADTTAPNQVTGLTFRGNSLTWEETHDTPGGNGVMQYHVEVASDASFSTILQTGTATTPEFALKSSEEGTLYVRVKAEDYTGNIGAWSETISIDNSSQSKPEKKFTAKSDVDGNGISDVMFVWTGEHGEGNYQHGYWMNGTSEWRSQNGGHPAEWENLGCHDMTGDGKADSVLVGNVEVGGVKGAYIGYYADAIDAVDGATWVNIGYLNNADDIAWKNKVGNLTGNASGANSIVWYAPELYALGVWTDGTENWTAVSDQYGGEDWALIGCGDFDGDGKDSILMSFHNGQTFYAVDLDGASVSLGSSGWSGWDVRAIGDFSGDGKDDLVLFNQYTGSIVMLPDGDADDFKSVGQLDAKDWFVVGAGDYDGDQMDDLLVRQYSTGMLGYYSGGDQNRWNVLGYGVGMEWTVIA